MYHYKMKQKNRRLTSPKEKPKDEEYVQTGKDKQTRNKKQKKGKK